MPPISAAPCNLLLASRRRRTASTPRAYAFKMNEQRL
jgi:hypothetical protein